MEAISNISGTENCTLAGGTITCSSSAVTPLDINSSVAVNLQELIIHHDVVNNNADDHVSGEKCLNEIPSDYEDTVSEHIGNNILIQGIEGKVPQKTVSPTIFENAVKVVKNLFSPAKGHSIFSRGIPQQNMGPEDGTVLEEESRIFDGTGLIKLDKFNERKSMTNLDFSLSLNEEDVNNSSVKNSSSSTDTHDNTNDSYTTTVSRMEESFQSTLTHFDEYMQSEVEKESEPTMINENNCILESSLNETVENALNDTLKKNQSICSFENEEVNDTFEVTKEESVEDSGRLNILCVEAESESRSLQDIDAKTPINEVLNFPHVTQKNLQLLGEERFKNITMPSDSACNRSSENITISVMDILSEKLEEFTEKSGNDFSSVQGNVEEESSVQLSTVNFSSELNCLALAERSENQSLEKIDNLKNPSDLEKNFSTSTIVISKTDIENAKDFNRISQLSDESMGEPNEALILKNHEFSEQTLTGNSNQNGGRESTDDCATKRSNFIQSDFDVDVAKVKECSMVELSIPLASQKSYTVLHNINPELNRPVVPDLTGTVQADKLNDIILGRCTFSDLSITCVTNVESKQHLESHDDKLPESSIRNGDGEVFNNAAEVLDSENDVPFDQVTLIPSIENKMLTNVEPQTQILKLIEADVYTTEMKLEKPSESASAIKGSLEGFPAHEDVSEAARICSSGIKEDKLQQITEIDPMCTVKSRIFGDCGPSLLDLSLSVMGPLDNGPMKKKIGNTTEEPLPTLLESPLGNTIPVADLTNIIDVVISDLNRPKVDNCRIDGSNSDQFDGNAATEQLEIQGRFNDSLASGDESAKTKNKPAILAGDKELAQFIEEQFTATDIEKICCVVDDIPELNLSKNIVMASQQFDKSFQANSLVENGNVQVNNTGFNNWLSSSCLDNLESIKGKPTGRDYSRESLYIKFDPLVQPKKSTELLDISEGDKENLILSPVCKNMSVTDPLMPITPLKQTAIPLSPLTPSSQKNETKLSTEKLNKLLELQSEVTRLREFYLQREDLNREKVNNYENEIVRLTGKVCVLEDKLKESEEVEKSLVKKLKTQDESLVRLKSIMDEYSSYAAILTDQIETLRTENHKEIEILKEERDYYMNHLQNTEQAFSDVHSKYEKCKKVVDIYKKNEETYKAKIDDYKDSIEHHCEKIQGIQETAAREMNRLQEKINEMKISHAQELSMFKAQMRKTELKLQTVQQAFDQKVKENQELARICDELIEGKKCSR